MQSVAVFCGSQPGRSDLYAEGARQLGRALAERGLRLVYGGGRVGLMGILADAVLDAGGTVLGVIPRFLQDREVAHERVTELVVVQTMHERKAIMAERADAFVAMPGGIGTLEEIIEVFSWAQLGLHHKPCALLDMAGFYAGLSGFFDHLVREGFVRAELRAALCAYPDVESLLAGLTIEFASGRA